MSDIKSSDTIRESVSSRGRVNPCPIDFGYYKHKGLCTVKGLDTVTDELCRECFKQAFALEG